MKIPEENKKALATIRAKLAPEFEKLGLVPRAHRDDAWELEGTAWRTIVSIEHRRNGTWSTTYRDTVLRLTGHYREPRFTARSVVLLGPKGNIDDKGIAKLLALVAERVRLEKQGIAAETAEAKRHAAAKKMVAALRRELSRIPGLDIDYTEYFFPRAEVRLTGNDPDDLKRKLRSLADAILDECPKPKEPT